MLNTKLIRTTIRMPEELLFEIKKEALLKKKTMTDLVSEGLKFYIRFKSSFEKIEEEKVSKLTDLFGVWGKGLSGLSTVKKLRYGRKETLHDSYLNKLWKKS